MLMWVVAHITPGPIFVVCIVLTLILIVLLVGLLMYVCKIPLVLPHEFESGDVCEFCHIEGDKHGWKIGRGCKERHRFHDTCYLDYLNLSVLHYNYECPICIQV